MIIFNDEKKVEINSDKLKSKPKLISLMGIAKFYGLDIDSLTDDETSKLMELSLIASR